MSDSFDFKRVESYIKSRPLGITILGALFILGGIWSLCAGVFRTGGEILTFCLLPGAFSTAIGAIVNGVLKLAVGGALFSGQGWVRTFAIVVSVINLITLVLSGSASGEIFNIVLSIGMILYMMTPGVTAYFSRR
jgi:hypothetical protein